MTVTTPDSNRRKSGTASIANTDTSTIITHECSYTPTAANITVSATSDLYDAAYFYFDTIGAVYFTIHTNIAPGTGNTATFGWSVEP